jgi:hypothetical protein
MCWYNTLDLDVKLGYVMIILCVRVVRLQNRLAREYVKRMSTGAGRAGCRVGNRKRVHDQGRNSGAVSRMPKLYYSYIRYPPKPRHQKYSERSTSPAYITNSSNTPICEKSIKFTIALHNSSTVSLKSSSLHPRL